MKSRGVTTDREKAVWLGQAEIDRRIRRVVRKAILNGTINLGSPWAGMTVQRYNAVQRYLIEAAA